ncbi:MBL fold metallo-hydrolase [Nesterenkonia sp. HG001]|uniref:MBL fold metallo-hydrolase n=1 Tax=Nesterenkonia sp. HG001 TaxID=2983207 RepID=UPI002AC62E59|nr:MBL fold metallo-hydrolase [Nesterenkonia sp. HG001]MDZ5077552.1 MBL fold metallo-hydrolase [Nesterenkonia sp. HG001]
MTMTTTSVTRLLCENPSPMTLEGTTTYLLAGEDTVAVVDPGPADHPEHLEAILSALGKRRVTQILVTHRHRDHTGAASVLAQRTGAPVRGADPEQCLPGADGRSPAPLTHGERLDLGDAVAEVVHTPGHTSDSICLFLPRAQVVDETGDDRLGHVAPEPAAMMLTGDTILGRGTTMLDHPDGTLTDYLSSLDRLAQFGDRQKDQDRPGHGDVLMLPAHGPAQPSLAESARAYLAHRQERLDQVRALLAEARPFSPDGEADPEALGRILYGTTSPLPARVTTKIAAAQLDHLRRLGEL